MLSTIPEHLLCSSKSLPKISDVFITVNIYNFVSYSIYQINSEFSKQVVILIGEKHRTFGYGGKQIVEKLLSESNALIDVLVETFYLLNKHYYNTHSILHDYIRHFKKHLPITDKKLPKPTDLKKISQQSQQNIDFISNVLYPFNGRLKNWSIDYRSHDFLKLINPEFVIYCKAKVKPDFDFYNFNIYFIQLINILLDEDINNNFEEFKRKLISKCQEICLFNNGYFDFSNPEKRSIATKDDLWRVNFDELISNINSLTETNKIIKLLKKFHILPFHLKEWYKRLLNNYYEFYNINDSIYNSFIYDISLMIYFFRLWTEHKTRYILILAGNDHINFFRLFLQQLESQIDSTITLIDEEKSEIDTFKTINIPKLNRHEEQQKTPYQKYLLQS
jgi:hypothetical protein